MKPYKVDSGFTLIELVVILLLLGILYVTALGKFQDWSTKDDIVVLEVMDGTIFSTCKILHVKAIIEGVQDQMDTAIDYDGKAIGLRYGCISSNRSEGAPKKMGGLC
jgi:MSHA pilin protein MshA